VDVSSVEIDNVGVSVAIVRLVARDPTGAVSSEVFKTVVANLGLAATLVEIDDTRGGLVSIVGVSDLANGGVEWTAPQYRQLLNRPGLVSPPTS